MADKLKEIPSKIIKWWNKFTAKQKTIIIAAAATVIFTFFLIMYFISRPQYIQLETYSSPAETSKAVEVLESAGITHREVNDALTIEVETSQLYQAKLALGSAGIATDEVDYDSYVKSGMSATTSDKERGWVLFRQAELAHILEAQEAVSKAEVILDIPPQTGTLIKKQEEASAYITLTLDGILTPDQAAGLARCVAAGLGNATTANITIADTGGTILFVGGDDYSSAGIAHTMQELQNQAQAMVANQVKSVLYGTGQYDQVSVTSHLDVDFSEYQETVNEYYPPDGKEQGMMADQTLFESSGSNSGGGIPGTDPNDGSDPNTYVYPDYGDSETSQSESETHYLPNQSSKNKITPAGSINYPNSSMAVSMITYREYHEESVKSQGLLDGLTWEQFKAENGADVKREVDAEYYSMVANASGISAEKITIIAYEHPVFYDKEGLNVSGTDILSIVMIVLILGLLAFVVLRSMRVKKAETEEEELSVETMLQSTPETTIEDIDLEAKSETRKMIEKFVDENPEAVANLLRNWLNEDWS